MFPFHEPALARSPAFRRQAGRPAKAGTPCQPPTFMAPMRDARIVEACHEPERRTPMRLDGNYFASSRIGVRRSDQVHGRNVRPKLEVEAPHEPYSYSYS